MIDSKIKKCYTVFMNKNHEFVKKLNLPYEISQKELYFVGGASRSILQNNTLPKDIDICGNLNVEEFASLGLQDKKYIKQLHSLRFQSGSHDIDLTAFRKEEYKKGYFPSKVERVETAFEDSFRRDFTINAIYISKSGEIQDFHNGVTHLKEGKISQITTETLKVDGMRIYRMVRFALTLGCEIEKQTMACAIENASNLLQIQQKRGMAEFNKFKEYITKDNIHILEELGMLSHLEISKHEITNK